MCASDTRAGCTRLFFGDCGHQERSVMTTRSVRSVLLAALAAFATASRLVAQSTPLSEDEVRQLIVRGEPADHARLNAHFTAIADRYAADAKRHEAMGQAFAGNTKLAHMAASQREHCRQLSARNLESAASLQELAAHHAKQATGQASSPPRGSERLEGAGGGRIPSDGELTKLSASAESGADHRALEGYFTGLAARYDREAKESAAFAASWRGMTRNPSAPALATRWDTLAKQQRSAAVEARDAAKMHRDHAAGAK